MIERHLDELYVTHIKPLPSAERLRLLAIIAQDLAQPQAERAPSEQLTITERLAQAHYQPGTLFKTAEEVDAFIREERDSWERS
ncbi:MAG: hypothetical protein H0X37_06610 [Herpetosiphonaceae bacterium]|nr:hypothetical protein [Herpetosiphonaceae bacterium]